MSAASKPPCEIFTEIAPQPHDARVEAGGQSPRRHRRIEAFAPLTQRFGIIATEIADVAPGKAAFLGQGAKAALRQQAAAGKDIGLDEIAADRKRTRLNSSHSCAIRLPPPA